MWSISPESSMAQPATGKEPLKFSRPAAPGMSIQPNGAWLTMLSTVTVTRADLGRRPV